MGWSIGFDSNWNRDIGYGVPAICDSPRCKEEIDRGLGYVCGGQPYGGEKGCGLFFCSKHLWLCGSRGEKSVFKCQRCSRYQKPYKPKPDTAEWINWKLTDESWAEWRKENAQEVHEMQKVLTNVTKQS